MKKLELERNKAPENENRAVKELICIMCPKGCRLKVEEGGGYAVTGNACPKGAEYGRKEVTNPTRVLTSTVKITGAIHSCCPVKTDRDIPKQLVLKAMDVLSGVVLKAPVRRGEVVVSNILGTGANLIATRDMEAAE